MDSQNAGNTDRDRAAHRGYPALDHVEIIADEGRKHCGGPEFPVRLRDRPYPVDRRGFVKQHGAPAVHLRIDKAWNEHAAAQSNRIKPSRDATIGYDIDDRRSVDQQCVICSPSALRENSRADPRLSCHIVSVTFLSNGGVSGSNPRSFASALAKRYKDWILAIGAVPGERKNGV